jgi:hypothetical protein
MNKEEDPIGYEMNSHMNEGYSGSVILKYNAKNLPPHIESEWIEGLDAGVAPIVRSQ